MITIAKCRNLDEALGLRSLLEASGIPAFIPDENTASVLPHHLTARSGVRLQVPDEKAEEAKQILDSRKAEE
jgi:hypothetical protein